MIFCRTWASTPETPVELPTGAVPVRDVLIHQLHPESRQQEIRQGGAGTTAGGRARRRRWRRSSATTRRSTITSSRATTPTCSIEYPVQFTAAEFLPLANKIAPRLYSIASSPKAHPGEVHLTVAVVKYHTHGRRQVWHRLGLPRARAGVEQGRDSGLHPADEAFPHAAAGRADDHGRAGHRHRAVPRVSRGAGDRGRQGQELALLRRPEEGERFPLRGAIRRDAAQGRADASSTPLSRATRRRRFTCRTGCTKTARNCGNGCRKAPTSTSAATPSAWRRTCTRC